MLKLSIITINLNNKAGLKRTMESVWSQTFKDFEYIVIDGGSNDGSVEIIKQSVNKINYWLSEPDNGIYYAMNKGVKFTKGEYLLFLNSGDYLDNPNIIKIVFDNNPQEDLLYGNYSINGIKNAFILPDVLNYNALLNITLGHQATFLKKELFNKYGLYNENNKIVSDWEFSLMVVFKYKCTYKHINEIISHREEGGISINCKFQALQIQERKNAIKRVLPEFYDTFIDYNDIREELLFYKSSRLVQFIKKLQYCKLYKLKNKVVNFIFG